MKKLNSSFVIIFAISGMKVFASQLSLELAFNGDPNPERISEGLFRESFIITYFSQFKLRAENASLTKSSSQLIFPVAIT